MIVSGFPDALQFARLSTAISGLKTQSEQARIELVTGKAANVGAALGGKVGNAQLVQKAIEDLEQFRISINRGLTRAALTQQGLARIADPTARLGADLLGAISFSDEPGIRLAATQARSDLETAISSFNQRFEGRALYSGNETDGDALGTALSLINDVASIFTAASDAAQFAADLDFYFNDPAGGFATSFYKGGSGVAPLSHLNDGETVDASAKADELEIRNLLRSLASIAVAGTAPASGKRSDALEAAGRGVIAAGASLSEIQARIGIAENQLQKGLEKLNAEELIFTEGLNDLVGRDPYEAASRLQQLETQLAASFTLSARISRLSLVNFL